MGANNVVVLFSFIYFCSFSSFVACQACTTPENKPGECILLSACPALNTLLQVRPVPQSTVEYLRKVHCGFTGKLPRVCCSTGTKNPTVSQDLLPSRQICGKQAQDRIIGGTATSIRELPWMALLDYQKPTKRGFSCGGSLINKRYILTAAHCLLRTPKTWTLIGVRLGEHTLNQDKDCENDTPGFEDCNDPPQDFQIEEKITHENYDPNDPNQPYDIALLRLDRDVTFSPFIKPICLPVSQELRNKNYFGEELTVAGWGRTENRSQSEVKLKVKVPVKRISDCQPIYRRNGVTALANTQICAGGEDAKDSCTGDSGGPLMTVDRTVNEENYIVYGIVSFGPTPCGIKNFPGIYTRVADYVDWIQSNMRP